MASLPRRGNSVVPRRRAEFRPVHGDGKCATRRGGQENVIVETRFIQKGPRSRAFFHANAGSRRYLFGGGGEAPPAGAGPLNRSSIDCASLFCSLSCCCICCSVSDLPGSAPGALVDGNSMRTLVGSTVDSMPLYTITICGTMITSAIMTT